MFAEIISGSCEIIWLGNQNFGMETYGLHERYASLDRGWRACLLAMSIVVGEIAVTAV